MKQVKLYRVLSILLIYFFLTLNSSIAQDGFSVNQSEGCAPLVSTFSYIEGANPTTITWDFGNSLTLSGDPATNPALLNPTISYLSPGSYSVSLSVTNDNGTQTYESINFITVFNDPVPNFTSDITEGCGSFPVTFSDQSTEGDAPLSQWNWDFGDGGYSDEQNPTHTYTNVGLYDVSLSLTDENGCNAVYSIIDLIDASAGVNPNFTLSSNYSCITPTVISIDNLSTGSGDIEYFWDFGNETTSTLQNPPDITYNSVGTYTIELSMTSDLGCTQSYSQELDIQIFLPDFEMEVICTDTTFFNNLSDEAFNTFSWNFGDPASGSNTSTQVSPYHIFSELGTYTVTLVSSIDGECETTIEKNVTITVPPELILDIESTFVCNLPAEVPVNVLNTNVSNLSWILEDEDGNFADSGNLNDFTFELNEYDQEGDYALTAYVFYANGCYTVERIEDVLTIDTINIYASILPQLLCEGEITIAKDSTEFVYDITSYLWDFGNGDFSTNAQTSYSYQNAGDYIASLNVSTDEGCENTKFFEIHVGILTDPSFTYEETTLCIDDSVLFTYTGDTSIVDSYLWSIEGIGLSTDISPYLPLYNIDSLHMVIITTQNNGCKDYDTVYANINALGPEALFGLDPSFRCKEEIPYETYLNNSTKEGDNSTYLWEFSDSYHENSTLKYPGTYAFIEPGYHNISLTASDSINGCVNTYMASFIIDDYHISFSNSVEHSCDELAYFGEALFEDVIDLSGSPMIVEWDFGDGSTDTTVSTQDDLVFHHYTEPGSYLMKIKSSNYLGCQDSAFQWINIHPSPIGSFALEDPNVCPPSNLQINNASLQSDTTIVSYNYILSSSDSTLNYSSENPIVYIENFEPYLLTQIIEDGFGCRDTSSINIIPPTFTIDYNVEENMCFNTFYPIVNNCAGSNPPLSYLWEFGTGISTPETNPSIYVDEFEESSFINYLSITDNTGCTVIDSFLVQMSAPSLNYYYNIDEGFCPPIYCDFQMTSPDSVFYFEIDYGDGEMNTVNSASEALNISHVYDSPGYYDVVFSVTDTNGCPATTLVDSLIFIPGPWATFTFSPNSGCPPLEVTFDILEQSDVDRYLWVFGDGYTSDLQNPTHIYSLAGTYTPILIVEDTINLVNGDTLPCITSHYNDDIVIEGPIVDFFILEDTLCFGSTNNLQIENITIDLEGYEIETYEWDYGDGTTASGQFPGVHSYDEPGTYSLSLTATTTNGCVYTMTKENSVYVMAPPSIQPYAEYTLSCPPMLVNFYADSLPSSIDDVSYYWDFDDGQSATGFSASHIYTNDESYTAILTTRIDSCEFIHSLSDQISSFPVPDAAFVSTPIFGNNTVEQIQFENASADEDYIEWYISNTYFSNENTINVDAQTDDLIMFLVAYNGFDCSDTARFSLNDYSWDIPNVITPNGDGNNDFFVLNYEGFGPCIELTIYNRWGTLIYQNANYKDDWYGKNQSGRKVSDGTYFYIINVCNKASITGYITVIH